MNLDRWARVMYVLAEAERLANATRAEDVGDQAKAEADLLRRARDMERGDFDDAMRRLDSVKHMLAGGGGEE